MNGHRRMTGGMSVFGVGENIKLQNVDSVIKTASTVGRRDIHKKCA